MAIKAAEWPSEEDRLRHDIERHIKICSDQQAEIEHLRGLLTKCANRLERCAIASGTDPEYALCAVQEYRDALING